MISKTERTELARIIRQQFRVLRSEVVERKAELLAQFEQEMADRIAAEDRRWQDALHLINEAVREANRAVNDILYSYEYATRSDSEGLYVRLQHLSYPATPTLQLRRTATARVEAQVRSALLLLDRDEADLLRSLAVEAIESEEARAFLGQIPTVGELVPATRLAELEQAMGEGS